MNTRDVTVIIPCWNRQQDLTRLMRSFSLLAEKPHIIVVDDGSDTPLVALDAQVIRLPQRIGTAGAKNIGLKSCNTPLVWFLDSDTEIIGCISSSVFDHFFDPKVGAVGAETWEIKGGERVLALCKILPDYSSLRWLLPLKRPVVKKVGMLTTCNLIVRVDALRAIGGFPDGLVISEDKILCFGLRERGYSIILDSGLAVVHRMSSAARLPDCELRRRGAIDSAFVFGAFASPVKLRCFRLFTILSRCMELLSVPKLILDEMKLAA